MPEHTLRRKFSDEPSRRTVVLVSISDIGSLNLLLNCLLLMVIVRASYTDTGKMRRWANKRIYIILLLSKILVDYYYCQVTDERFFLPSPDAHSLSFKKCGLLFRGFNRRRLHTVVQCVRAD